ncbi:Qat anti-phage system QueC-like protein QatC [Tuberibacillus calidus]|uniref:Qat anti-phage system QueC-like protein QatC n=1 Tax=Tuberibacillus calidus TaxID=340097 RepID=UPI0003F9FF2E|nr:Qat anti-phage system QueC-like protein QatC [Tuberibacillus calidus]
MYNIWINKNSNDFNPGKSEEEQFFIFNLFDKTNKSNVKTDMEQLWRKFGKKSLSTVNEDFLVIASSVFCADKRLPRKDSSDNWTRIIKLSIPVLEFEKWNSVKEELEYTIGFLSGDKWIFDFRQTDQRFRADKTNTKNLISIHKHDSISLFSGGLDSFCGALTLSENNNNTLYIGFREYNLLTNRQRELFDSISNYYPKLNIELLLFSVNPLAPIRIGGDPKKLAVESTSRSRSLLFIAGAISVASIIGKETPVYIPENGFIGVNVPLTDSRSGSCSTRTTHPIFIKSLNNILEKVGIENKVSNFYWNKSKGEILEEHQSNPIFKQYASRTLSCSHPCQSRYDKKKSDKVETPCNCGYCYPCLIRRASFSKIGKDNTRYNPLYELGKDFILNHNNNQGRASDLKAVLFSLRRYIEHKENREYIRSLLMRQGPLDNEELDGYERVYHQSMEEILEMVKSIGNGLMDFAGIEEVEINE